MRRISSANDRPALKQLWQTCFGDTMTLIDLYFQNAWQPQQIFVFEADGAPRAMAAWFPCSIGLKPAAYFYAVCTEPAYRGQGLCQQIMAYAEQQLTRWGISQFLLVPGEESLFRFYARMGYRVAGTVGEQIVDTPSPGRVVPISPEEYQIRREAALHGNYVAFSPQMLRYQQCLSQFSGGELYAIGASGCAAVEKMQDGTLLCKELVGCQPSIGGSALLHALQAPTGVVRFPDSRGRDFVMGKHLADFHCYLGLAFD